MTIVKITAMPNPSIQFICLYLLLFSLGCTGETDSSTTGTPDIGYMDGATDGGLDAAPLECQSDEACADNSSCTTDTCVDGRCVHLRIEAVTQLMDLMATPDSVTSLYAVGDLMLLARGALGSQVWNIAEVPPRKLIDYAAAEDEAEHAGLHHFDGGVVVRSGRWMYVLDGMGRRVGEYRASDEIRQIIPYGEKTVILALYAKGIEIVDLGNGIFPMRVGRTDTLGRAQALAISGRLLLVADGLVGLSIVDIGDPSSPVLREQSIETEGRIEQVSTSGRAVVVNEEGAGIGLLRATTDTVHRQGIILTQLDVVLVHLLDPTTLLVVTKKQGIIYYDISDLQAPVEWKRQDVAGDIVRAAPTHGHLLLQRADGRTLQTSLSCGLEGEAVVDGVVTADAGGLSDGGMNDGGD